MGASDSKLAFRQNIFKLASDEELTDEFLAELFSASHIEMDDYFVLLSSADVRKTRDRHSGNLRKLLHFASKILINADFSSSAATADNLAVLKVTNAVRILTRFFPYLFEVSGNSAEDPGNVALDDSLFWEEPKGDEGQHRLGEKLLAAVVELLFTPGFTLPVDASPDRSPVSDIWYPGLGRYDGANTSTKFLEVNRLEVLRLLLTLISKGIYYPPQTEFKQPNKYLEFVVTHLENDLVVKLVFSLLNCVLNYSNEGSGSWVPYDHVILGDDGKKEQLVQTCSSLLVILLSYTNGLSIEPSPVPVSNDAIPPVSNDTDSSIPKSPLENWTMVLRGLDAIDNAAKNENGPPLNKLRACVASIVSQEDFKFIFDSMCALLQNPFQSNATYLPNSVKSLNVTEEVLMIFWKLVEVNNLFFVYVCNSEKSLDGILLGLLYQCLSNKNSIVLHSKIGLLRMCSFVLHVLSGERNFAVLLNKAYPGILPSHFDLPSFKGSYADLLVLTIYSLIYTTKGRLSSLYDCFFTIIANISPYIKSFSIVTANKLLVMFKTFSSPTFLLANESNHVLIFFLLDTFNNIIQYQFDGNSNLNYEIMRHQKLFFELRDLKFQRAKTMWSTMQQKKQGRKLSVVSNNDEKKGIQEEKTNIDVTPSIQSNSNEKIDDGTLQQETHDDSSQVMPAGSQDELNVENERKDMKADNTPSSPPQGVIPQLFVPNEKWFKFWHQQLPLQTILSLLETLVPQVEKMCQEDNMSDDAVINFLQSGTLVGLLPVPHPIFVRKFQYTEGIHLWFTSYVWGVTYLRHTSPNPTIWIGTRVKLFVVKSLNDQ